MARYDSSVRMLSTSDREKEIAAARTRMAQLKALKQNMPDGIDPDEIRQELRHLSGKIGRHKRAFTCTPEELKEKIAQYFDEHQVVEVDADGNVIGVKQIRPMSMTGLATYLGISQPLLCRYAAASDEYGEIIAYARSKIMQIYEERLTYDLGRNQAGLIFALKQMGWTDEQKISVRDDTERPRTAEEIAAAIEADIV